MASELDFNMEPPALIWYVADQIMLAESGDKRDMGFLEFMWDRDPDALAAAHKLVIDEGWIQ